MLPPPDFDPEVGAATVHATLDRTARKYASRGLRIFPNGAFISFRELADKSKDIARNLQSRGIGKGSVVGICLKTSSVHVATLFGIWRTGAAVAPLAIPLSARALTRSLARLAQVLTDARSDTVVIEDEFMEAAAAAGLETEFVPVESLLGSNDRSTAVDVDSDALAILQYTSGSTATPKGVPLTHRQVLAGMRAISVSARVDDRDILCNWLPLSHDMGLISLLSFMAVGCSLHWSSPSAFIKSPRSWLEHCARAQATCYIAPNFSYQAMLDAIPAESVDGLDLSHLRLTFNGAEQVDPLVIERFVQRFSAAGLRPEAMYPVYGMAEATLACTFPTPGEAPRVEWVDRRILAEERRAVALERSAPGARGVVSVGTPVHGLELRITKVDDDAGEGGSDPTDVLGERVVGEVEIRGAAVMSGYRNGAPGVLRGGWVRTGDLAYRSEGQVFIVGRLKEMMKLHGRSYYAEDVEFSVRPLPGIFAQRVVAFVDQHDAAEQMIVVAETDVTDLEGLKDAIRQRVAYELGMENVSVYLVAPGSIPRTTSGKLQRTLTKKQMRERVKSS